MNLHVDDDELAACVACGLCLPHCPTFRVTGEEALSPRGRIAAMRRVHLDGAPADADFLRITDTCVQCRGCETACPSGVPFGRLMEATRESLAGDRATGYPPRWRRLTYRALGWHGAVLAGSSALAVAQRARLVPSRRLGLPDRLPLRRPQLEPSGADVYLFTGCVMDAWQRDIHVHTQAVLEAAGYGVGFLSGGCCGALHEHAGLGHQARGLARRVIAAAPDRAPIVVNSAGCGALLKDYGRLLDTDEAHAFSARVSDVHEWLAARLDRLPPPRHHPDRAPRVAVQDPCHLRHVQGAHLAVREVLRPYVGELRELDDEGLCCGAGGAYAQQHVELATDIRRRKVDAVRRSGAEVVASANPGCLLHLQAAGLDVRHPMSLVATAIGGGP